MANRKRLEPNDCHEVNLIARAASRPPASPEVANGKRQGSADSSGGNVSMTKSESAILTLMVVSFFAGIFYQQNKLVLNL